MDAQTNITPSKTGAISMRNLIDAIDLLHEAQQVNEAAFMACGSLAIRSQKEALQRVLAMCGDILKNVADTLEVIRAEVREGGAS
ncbi:MAG: hypothetical protein ACOH2N_14985 [Devosia sp.]